MTTKFVGIPDQLMDKVKEAANREEVSVEELVCDALEQRINGKGFSGLFAIAKRRGQQTGITSENVDAIVQSEIAARRNEHGR